MESSNQSQANRQPDIIRTGKGLTIAGTKITLYDVLDYLKAQQPPHRIREKLRLSKAQIGAAFAYIEAYKAELEAEYREILKTAEENRRYWGTHSRYRLAPVQSVHSSLEQAALKAKLRIWQSKLSVSV
ncbi:MAG: DUF433 domain-containing protein [Cyanobacteria bacterium J06627_28]